MRRLHWVFAAAGFVALVADCADRGLGRAAWLFVVDVESGERRQLTDDARAYSSPSWSPDSRRLAVSRDDQAQLRREGAHETVSA